MFRRSAVVREPLIKTQLRRFWELTRQPNSDAEIQRLGKELLAEYPSDSEVLNACIKQDEPLCRLAYDQFMVLRLNENDILQISHMLWQHELEPYYEDAYQKVIAFLENHLDMSAQVLGYFAHEIKSYETQAMTLLETRIPTLSHEALIAFVMQFPQHVPNPVEGEEIKRVRVMAARRLLAERPHGVGGSGVELRMLFMPDVRAQAADWMFTHRFDAKQWENVLHLVPEKHTDAWEFAFRNNKVTFDLWCEQISWFETAEKSKDNPAHKLSADDWNYLWLVGERLPDVNNEQWAKVACGSLKLGVNATKKLITLNDVDNLAVIVAHSRTQKARIEAARHLLGFTENELVLVKIISGVPSLRREAARKLADLPEEA